MLHVQNIEKYYGTTNNVTKALDRVSFTVEDGEFLAIMGASGSGKTTLLNCISTIDTVSSGHILLEGRDVRCTIIAKLADPDAYGAERVALYNVSFDDETIMDFAHGQLGKTTHPFTFTRREWLDVVRPG